ncbi:hypothetical protein EC957_003732 [Mortierella hygrophila]|uniref:Uncharacterized protein n=1 Tax=Mortierella hygrophila TaxID=979708 RepID=A0A9P6F2C0_9FUNG|nr:hypothetical protein EC957_003732 [Mortierella hygrophila]
MFRGRLTNCIRIHTTIRTLSSLSRTQCTLDIPPAITATTSTRTMAMHGQIMELSIMRHLVLVIHPGCVILCPALRVLHVHNPRGWI